MEKKRCLIWTTAIADLFDPHKAIGGFSVQMYLWSKTFYNNGWDVFTFTSKQKQIDQLADYVLIKEYNTNILTAFLYFVFSFWVLIKVRPDIVITRGGKNRNLYFISICCKILKIEQVHFMGSDKDLTNEYDSFSDKMNKSLFRKGLALVNNVIAQNEFQCAELNNKLHKKKILLIPNIWGDIALGCNDQNELIHSDNYILWIGNIKHLKQPLMVLDIAKRLPNYHFIMIGGNQDSFLYEKCIEKSSEINNLDFLGGKNFFDSNDYFKKAKVFICTSEYEGFPNTFLQSWFYNIPVFSTVDPSNVIKKYGLGGNCNSVDDFVNDLENLMTNECKYKDMQANIKEYFMKAHNAQFHYTRLIEFISE